MDFSEPRESQRARRAEIPPFDLARSVVRRDHGVLAERVRTWPGALRSDHPEAGVAALGARAAWLTAQHPADFAFGPGTPYERLKQAGGKVLLLGAPLNTITMLHHAESIAPLPGKINVVYEMLVLVDGERVWREYRDIDSANGRIRLRPRRPALRRRLRRHRQRRSRCGRGDDRHGRLRPLAPIPCPSAGGLRRSVAHRTLRLTAPPSPSPSAGTGLKPVPARNRQSVVAG